MFVLYSMNDTVNSFSAFIILRFYINLFISNNLHEVSTNLGNRINRDHNNSFHKNWDTERWDNLPVATELQLEVGFDGRHSISRGCHPVTLLPLLQGMVFKKKKKNDRALFYCLQCISRSISSLHGEKWSLSKGKDNKKKNT